MKAKNNDWNILTVPFDENFNDALQQQHQAAQFLALAGKYLIPQQADDSNTNMQYLAGKQAMVGNELSNGFRLGLILTSMEIQLLNKAMDAVDIIQLNGKTRQQIFEEIKRFLKESGEDISRLKDKLHYEIPYHPVADGRPFTLHSRAYLKETAFHRENSEIILKSIVNEHKNGGSIRIWPHHFDTGVIIPIKYGDHKEVAASLGLGYAMPDTMVTEPYFYLSFWSEDSTEIGGNLPDLTSGTWMLPEWNGGVLKLSEILKCRSAGEQQKIVQTFFSSGIKILNLFILSKERHCLR